MGKKVKGKKLKVWTVACHRKGDVTDTYIENFQAKSRKDLMKQPKKVGVVIDKATLKRK